MKKINSWKYVFKFVDIYSFFVKKSIFRSGTIKLKILSLDYNNE
jgi:hypothetical protein